MHVPSVHWIVVEDSSEKTKLVERLLSGEHSCRIAKYTHINFRTAKDLQIGKHDKRWTKTRGAEQRNHGIDWLLLSAAKGVLNRRAGGVVYFADDDNTYDTQLFKEVGGYIISL